MMQCEGSFVNDDSRDDCSGRRVGERKFRNDVPKFVTVVFRTAPTGADNADDASRMECFAAVAVDRCSPRRLHRGERRQGERWRFRRRRVDTRYGQAGYRHCGFRERRRKRGFRCFGHGQRCSRGSLQCWRDSLQRRRNWAPHLSDRRERGGTALRDRSSLRRRLLRRRVEHLHPRDDGGLPRPALARHLPEQWYRHRAVGLPRRDTELFGGSLHHGCLHRWCSGMPGRLGGAVQRRGDGDRGAGGL